MACNSCHSVNQRTFDSEISVHSSRFADDDRSTTIRPQWTICMDCGRAVLRVPITELELLIDGVHKEVQEVEGK
jgi:hypothetical protein